MKQVLLAGFQWELFGVTLSHAAYVPAIKQPPKSVTAGRQVPSAIPSFKQSDKLVNSASQDGVGRGVGGDVAVGEVVGGGEVEVTSRLFLLQSV